MLSEIVWAIAIMVTVALVFIFSLFGKIDKCQHDERDQ